MMTIAAARALTNDDVCFVGIGAPSAACNVARLTHAPDITLIYESGTIGTRPDVLPLSIGDGELCETALTTVSVPEMFRTGCKAAVSRSAFSAPRSSTGSATSTRRLSATMPARRCGCRAAAAHRRSPPPAEQVYITLEQSRRSMVETIDFFTSFGHGEGGDHRQRIGIATKGPTLLVTDLAIWTPDPVSKEFTVASLHPGVDAGGSEDTCGWPVRFADSVDETPPPTPLELTTLRDLKARTEAAHQRGERHG